MAAHKQAHLLIMKALLQHGRLRTGMISKVTGLSYRQTCRIVNELEHEYLQRHNSTQGYEWTIHDDLLGKALGGKKYWID